MRRIIFFFGLLILFFTVRLFGDIPVKKENVIYTITAFNGLHFSRTFCREESDTIYILQNVHNFFIVRKAFVYFWPLSGKWMAEPLDIRKPKKISLFEGTLQIEQAGKMVKSLETELYIIYNLPGKYSNNWQVFIGEEAKKESAILEKILTEYEEQYNEYQLKYDIYAKAKEKLVEKMKTYREAGKDTIPLVEQYKALEEPEMPLNPTPPELNMGKQFHVVLPEGVYTIRLRNKEGLILEGSEKNLVVFSERRRKGVGYRIVPGDRWTKPIKSYSPSYVLYVDATTDIYLVPFLEDEYNDLYYNKLLQNDSRGNMKIYRWEEVKELPDSQLEITRAGESISTEQEKFYVEPLKGGASLGYKIVPYDPEGAHKDRNYEFSGFHVPVHRNDNAIHLKLQDTNGNYYPLSGREIRIIKRSSLLYVLLFFVFFPLVVMTIVMVLRQKQYGQSIKKADNQPVKK